MTTNRPMNIIREFMATSRHFKATLHDANLFVANGFSVSVYAKFFGSNLTHQYAQSYTIRVKYMCFLLDAVA